MIEILSSKLLVVAGFLKLYIPNDYNLFKYGNQTFRIEDKLSKELNEPRFKIGDHVSGKSISDGIVVDIMWHYKKQSYFYFVSSGGKKRSRRYYEEELKASMFD